ncbi:MAG: hypothetical protein AAFO84_12620 [Cyanobacteria bacterium J06598_1]
MTRTYSNFNTDLSKEQLALIADKSTSPTDYKTAMTLLGEHLGQVIAEKVENSSASLCLACTVEDADYLAAGVLNPLEQHFQAVSLACFWNERFSPFDVSGLKAAPIIREYKEPTATAVTHLVILKSVISSGCVVRTNITNLIQVINPESILIAAPVIYAGAEERLAADFSASVHERFQFIYLAEDDERSLEGEVIPGIGGMVYERLGFSGQEEKNKYVPNLVKARRRQLISAQ